MPCGPAEICPCRYQTTQHHITQSAVRKYVSVHPIPSSMFMCMPTFTLQPDLCKIEAKTIRMVEDALFNIAIKCSQADS